MFSQLMTRYLNFGKCFRVYKALSQLSSLILDPVWDCRERFHFRYRYNNIVELRESKTSRPF